MNRIEFDQWLEEVRELGWQPGLSRIKSLLKRRDNPQNKLDIIHISGTNGKGSTATLLANILTEAGYKTGQFSTPSILGFNEMFLLDGEAITDLELCEIAQELKLTIDQMILDGEGHPTEYEIIAAIMYEYFCRRHVDFAVVEVAMGGENDCTNVMDYSILSMMTPISMDHSDFLGDSLQAIAHEKAGIIKYNSVLVTHDQAEEVMAVLMAVCESKMSVLKRISCEPRLEYENGWQYFTYRGLEVKSQLLGNHQAKNIIVVIEAIQNLKQRGYVDVTPDQLLRGIEKTHFSGRFEILDQWILDGAHNDASLMALAQTLKLTGYRDLIGVFGVLGDKSIEAGLLALKPYLKGLVLTEPENPRKLSVELLGEKLEHIGMPVLEQYQKIEEAVNYAANLSGQKIAFGSFYMIESIRKLIK